MLQHQLEAVSGPIIDGNSRHARSKRTAETEKQWRHSYAKKKIIFQFIRNWDYHFLSQNEFLLNHTLETYFIPDVDFAATFEQNLN